MHSDKEDEVEEEVGSSPGVRFSSLFQGFRLRGPGNEWFSSRSLTSRHTLLSELLEQPRFQGSFLIGPRREGEDSCNKVAPWTGYDFWKVPVAFWARKQTFKSKSLLTGSFELILCAKLLKPQLFGAVNYRDFPEAGPWSPFLESPGGFSGPESCLHLPYLHSRSKFQ